MARFLALAVSPSIKLNKRAYQNRILFCRVAIIAFERRFRLMCHIGAAAVRFEPNALPKFLAHSLPFAKSATPFKSRRPSRSPPSNKAPSSIYFKFGLLAHHEHTATIIEIASPPLRCYQSADASSRASRSAMAIRNTPRSSSARARMSPPGLRQERPLLAASQGLR
jgi:hypothetical protein